MSTSYQDEVRAEAIALITDGMTAAFKVYDEILVIPRYWAHVASYVRRPDASIVCCTDCNGGQLRASALPDGGSAVPVLQCDRCGRKYGRLIVTVIGVGQ